MLASIDVGTNTLRLLLGEVEQGRVVPATYLRRITRLGGGFDPDNGLAEVAMERTLSALCEFAAAIEQHDVTRINAVATEALRRAPNGGLFVDEVKLRCGLALEVIPGELEAQLSCDGILSALDPAPERLLIFDIGGGSTEFVYVVDGRPVFSRSYPLGTVMLCEHHPGEVAQQAHIDRTLRCLADDMARAGFPHPLPHGTVPVGTAGTVTTLAALDMQMTDYDWRRVNNYHLDRIALDEIFDTLYPLTVAEREALPGMEVGRGDLILPGLKIVLSILDFSAAPELVVSDFGLLEGGLLRAAGLR